MSLTRQIPTALPIRPDFSIGGMVTVTDGNVDLDLTKPATSDQVTISSAEIGVTKRVSQIERGGRVIWPNASDPMPPVTAGDRITYSITVTNTGGIQVTNLEITDSLAGYIPPSTTILAPDEEVTVTAVHIVTTDSQDPLVNQVTVTARSTIVPFNTVDAQASAIVDILDSALEVTLSVEDPATGNPITSVTPPAQVRYRLVLHNAGATQINSLSYVAVGLPL